MVNPKRHITPGPNQESVWDYPRPPRVERTSKRIRVIFNGVTIADSTKTYRVLETSHPPVYYIPPEDLQRDYLKVITHRSFCEFKGMASYYTVSVGDKSAAAAAWYYPTPTRGYEVIVNHVAFYPNRMDSCWVDDEQAQAQVG